MKGGATNLMDLELDDGVQIDSNHAMKVSSDEDVDPYDRKED